MRLSLFRSSANISLFSMFRNAPKAQKPCFPPGPESSPGQPNFCTRDQDERQARTEQKTAPPPKHDFKSMYSSLYFFCYLRAKKINEQGLHPLTPAVANKKHTAWRYNSQWFTFPKGKAAAQACRST